MPIYKDSDNNFEYFDAEVNTGNWEKNDHYYFNNEKKFVDQCCHCGKGIKSYDKAFITRGYGNPLCLVNKKDHHRLDTDLKGGDMGSYFLGSECARQVKKQLIQAGLNWKDYLK